MRIVSLELAEQLKNAGLKWEPKRGNFYMQKGCERDFTIDLVGIVPDLEDIWLPTLSDLLDELEKMGIDWQIYSIKSKYVIELWNRDKYPHKAVKAEIGDTKENAAAKTLLWALGQANVLPST